MSNKIKHFYEFGEFRLDAENPSLWRGNQLVMISPKALETLILLVERKGEIVSRDELLEKIWKDTFVEEGNINYTVSLLRKTLGEKKLIQTVARHGYRFVADVKETNGKSETDTTQDIQVSEISPEKTVQKKPSRWHLVAIALLSLFLVSSFAVWWRVNDKPIPLSERSIKTVAILPLRNINEDERNNALSLGLTDSLISRFGSLNRFIVRPLDAVENYPKSGKDALRFGEELKCDAVLEGTFQSVQNRLRVNVRLMDVRDGAQLWTANFDESESDIFKLQDKISNQVANSLTQNLTTQEAQILSKKYTENPEAFRAYIRGRAMLDQRISGKFELTVNEFQKAVALDPTFALAYTGLADTFSRQGNNLTGGDASEVFKKAEFYALKALELDADSADVYVSLGRIKQIRYWDWTGAENDFTRAINLNPNHAGAHLYNAQMLSFLGRCDESLDELNKAADINPISTVIMNAHFSILESCGKYDEALKFTEESIKLNTGNRNTSRALGTILFHKGEYAKVIEMGEQILAKDGEPKFAWLALLSTAYRRTNQIEKSEIALRQLEELSQRDTKALYSLAMNYTELNRIDEAISALQKCFEMREERMLWINVEPRFANLRTDARFQELLQKMNLK